MGPRLRKFALTAHVTASVGWLGAVAAFLVLALAGLLNGDAATVGAAYVAMGLVAWYLIVPLAFAALLTGIVQSLGTEWGLFRHYWVLLKLVITLLATLLLLVHMRPIDTMANLAADGPIAADDHRGLRIQLVGDAAAAMVALVAATVLSIYKPRGVTPYGRRKRREGPGTL